MLNEIAKEIAVTVKENVQAGIKALSDKFETRIKAVEDRFNELPVPKDGKSVTVDDVKPVIDEEVQKSIQSIKLPEVDYIVLKEFISDEVSKIPTPQDGKSITIDDVSPLLKELVDGIEIPVAEKGEPGDSVTLDDVLPVINEAVEKAAQGIKAPEVDYSAIQKFVTDEVSKIPPPQDGKTVTVEDVQPILEDAVKKAVKDIHVPEVDYDVIKEFVTGSVSKIPPPEDGKSVTVEDVKPLILDTVKSAIAEIPLPKDGEPGKDALPIDMSEVQRMIDAAVEKAVSKIDIPTPKNGDDGKDALDIEILPEIDTEKSYSRNSYAVHKGGLWRSYERTKGMRGWETVVEGIADIQIEYDGERGVKIVTEKSSGEVVSKDFVMPMVIDRGVYKEGHAYTKNDGVTFGGSYWIAQKDTPEGKPGDGNSDFRLAVKKGRDANPKVKVK